MAETEKVTDNIQTMKISLPQLHFSGKRGGEIHVLY